MKLSKLLIIFLIVSFLLILIFPIGYYILENDNDYSTAYDDKVDVFKPGKVGTFLINLDSSTDRLKFMKKFTDDLSYDFNRIPGVDGKNLPQSYIDEHVDFNMFVTTTGKMPSPGVIGCYLSHLKTWETFLNSDYEFALILEDDVGFNTEIIEKVSQDLIINKEFWDVASLQMFHRGHPKSILQLSTGNYLGIYLTEVVHSGAYLINREGAKKLLSKSLPIKMPIDLYFTRVWELDITFAGVERPRLVHQLYGNSEINKTSLSNESDKTLPQKIQHTIYKFQTFIIRWYKNYMLYRKIKSKQNESQNS